MNELIEALLEEISAACSDEGGGMTFDELRGYVHGLAAAALAVLESLSG